MATVLPPLFSPASVYADWICAGPSPLGVLAAAARPAARAADRALFIRWFAVFAAASVRCRAKQVAWPLAGAPQTARVVTALPAAAAAAGAAAWAVAVPSAAATSAMAPVAARRSRRT